MDKEYKFAFKVKQVCLSGLYLRMFEYDCNKNKKTPSGLLREIVKEHYKLKPPLGFFTKD